MITKAELPYMTNLLSLIPEIESPFDYQEIIAPLIESIYQTDKKGPLPQLSIFNPLGNPLFSQIRTDQKVFSLYTDQDQAKIFVVDDLHLEDSVNYLMSLYKKLNSKQAINTSSLSLQEIILLLSMEIEGKQPQDINIEIVIELLTAIQSVMTPNNLQEIATQLSQIQQRLIFDNISPQDENAFQKARFLIYQILNTPMSSVKKRNEDKSYIIQTEQLNVDFTDKLALSAHSDNRVKTVEEYLKNNLKGQPEVIERILDIEHQRLIFGHLGQQGITLKFMGLPGVGKDTAAKAWIDGIHNQKEAWKEQKHLLSVPPIRNEMDQAVYIGSAPGYVGSEDIPFLIHFLVAHSGGKYLIVNERELTTQSEASQFRSTSAAKKSWHIILNPQWKGQSLSGYHNPDEGIVFLNDVHDWSKSGRNFIKTFLEEGRIRIANSGIPSGSVLYKNQPVTFVNELIVPVIRIEASNELSYLIATNRRVDGTYNGSPLSEKALLENWQRVHNNYSLIRKSLLDEGVARSTSGMGDNHSFGLSQEYLDRFNDENLLLFRPLTSDAMREILIQEIALLVDEFKGSTTGFANIHWRFSEKLITFVQNWQHQANQSARSLKGKKDSLIRTGIIDAIRKGYITPDVQPITIYLDIKENTDGTSSLFFVQSSGQSFDILIRPTRVNKHKEHISTKDLQHIYSLGDRLSQHVFGINHIVKRLGEQIASELPNRNKDVTIQTARRNAQTYVFLGLSSIGKTELSKALAREVYGDEDRLLIIPFGDIKTVTALEEWILGRIENGKVKKSKLMEIWDRTNGQFIVNLDEITNAPESIQEVLYDLLREKIYSNFADREPRPTENLIVTISDNATQEWYTHIARKIPMVEQLAAINQIYAESIKDKDFLRASVEKHFKNALINRVGLNNIFFFPPLSYQSVRHIVHRYLLKGILDLAPQVSYRPIGWHVYFLDEQAFRDIVKVIEVEGFELFEQGASLIYFIENDIMRPLNILLGQNQVPIGSDVTLYLKDISDVQVVLGVLTEDHRDLSLNVQRKDIKDIERVQTSPVETFLTALHEAGHNLMDKLLFDDVFKSDELSIITGVAQVEGQWERILGIHKSIPIKNINRTREAFIAKMAVLSAGYVAEELVTKNGRSAEGKANDIKRATNLAYKAILCYGLSPRFGNLSCPNEEALETWLQTFPEEEKQKIFLEVQDWIREAHNIAQNALTANFDVLLTIAKKLVEKGKLYAHGIEKIYRQTLLNKLPLFDLSKDPPVAKREHSHIHNNRDMELREDIQRPRSVMSNVRFFTLQKSKELAQVKLPDNIPFAVNPDILYRRIRQKRVSMPKVYQYDHTRRSSSARNRFTTNTASDGAILGKTAQDQQQNHSIRPTNIASSNCIEALLPSDLRK